MSDPKTCRPNIILITDDQHRGDTLGFMGHPCVRTPHLDQLAFEGVSFRNAYSTCPVCIPARTSLITGIEAHEYGCPHFAADYRIDRRREDYLASRVTAAGYQTCLIGKTHWHTHPTFRAGFETMISLHRLAGARIKHNGAWGDGTGLGGNECHPVLNHLPPELQSTNWLVEQSLEFVRYRDRTQPFFLWLSINDPHPPFSTYEPYYSMYDSDDIPEPVMPEWASDAKAPYSLYRNRLARNGKPMRPNEVRKMRGVYYGIISNIDFQLGRLFGLLQLEGLWEDTMVIFTSDHGEMLGDFGGQAKGEFFDSTAQVPFIVKPAKDMQNQVGVVRDSLVTLSDLYPTICETASAQVPGDVTAKSMVPLITGEKEQIREYLYGQIDDSYMGHDGRYKYLYFKDDGTELVFDVSYDRADAENLSGDVALTSSLRNRFTEYAEGIGSDVLNEDGALRNAERTKGDPRQYSKLNPLAWEVSHWSMDHSPRDTHYVQKGTGESPSFNQKAQEREEK